MAEIFRRRADGIDLFVRLTPKASEDRIGLPETAADGRAHLSARVRAVPEKGAANAALERLVAEWLGLGKGSVAVVAGGTSRLKTLRLTGDPQALAERISARLAAAAQKGSR